MICSLSAPQLPAVPLLAYAFGKPPISIRSWVRRSCASSSVTQSPIATIDGIALSSPGGLCWARRAFSSSAIVRSSATVLWDVVGQRDERPELQQVSVLVQTLARLAQLAQAEPAPERPLELG